MKKYEYLEITITAKKRVWCDVIVHFSNYDYATRSKKETVSELPVNERVRVRGYLQKEHSRYGTVSELIIASEEDLEAQRQAEISRWIALFREKAEKEYYIYKRAIDEIHALDCHDYDDEFCSAPRTIEIKKWIDYFRKNYENGAGYVYETAVTRLHEMNCRDYDEEIDEARRTIAERKREEKAIKDAEERDRGIVRLSLPAHRGFDGRPHRGQTILYRGSVYRVISSYYNREDALSFGVYPGQWYCIDGYRVTFTDEDWYYVKAQDVTKTEEGRRILAAYNREKAVTQAETDCKNALSALIVKIESMGKHYQTDRVIDLLDIPGYTVYDDMNIYGGGHLIRIDSGKIILVHNNGTDGGDWSRNNIITGGAGAYGFICDFEEIRSYYEDWKKKKNALEALTIN